MVKSSGSRIGKKIGSNPFPLPTAKWLNYLMFLSFTASSLPKGQQALLSMTEVKINRIMEALTSCTDIANTK